MSHMKSSTLTSSSGRTGAAAGSATARTRAGSRSTSSVCWPSSGAGRRYLIGLAEKRANGPGTVTAPSSTQKSRATSCGSSSMSATVRTGATMKTRRRASANTASLVRVRKKVRMSPTTRSSSDSGSAPESSNPR